MSACPSCGVKGRHVGLFVPRDPAKRVRIIHECAGADCLVDRWNEYATHDLAEILAGWGR